VDVIIKRLNIFFLEIGENDFTGKTKLEIVQSKNINLESRNTYSSFFCIRGKGMPETLTLS
jgi:hypothetical protein